MTTTNRQPSLRNRPSYSSFSPIVHRIADSDSSDDSFPFHQFTSAPSEWWPAFRKRCKLPRLQVALIRFISSTQLVIRHSRTFPLQWFRGDSLWIKTLPLFLISHPVQPPILLWMAFLFHSFVFLIFSVAVG